MAKRKRRRRSFMRRYGRLLIAAAVVIIAVIILISVLGRRGDTPTPTAANTPAVTEAPSESETPLPEATQSPSIIEGRLVPPETDKSSVYMPKTADGYLPVYDRRADAVKRIAITVDDLWQEDNVAKLLDICDTYGAKLTFFPIGEAVADDAALLKRIHEAGHEIENHTYNHVNLYSLSTEEMVEQLTKQNAAISNALGVDYKMHFLRPRGGNADYDLRMHKMLQQMDYCGVSHWSVSGTPEIKSWFSKLKDGDVILFHATDADLAKLTKAIPKLVELGYELVTLNELYGLPENETYPLGSTTIGTSLGLDTAEMEDIPYGPLSKGDTSYQVRRMQLRLTELGFYDIACDGDYGDGTASAVSEFQKAAGLTADGIAGQQTIDMLFSDSAPHK